MVEKFRALSGIMKQLGLKPFRICTDVSGTPFWTLVVETEAETLDDLMGIEKKVMAVEEAGKIMSGYHELITSGRREIYRLES